MASAIPDRNCVKPAGAEQLDTPETMLDNLFNDIINDIVAPRSTTHLNESRIMTESEKVECRRQIAAILERTCIGGLRHPGQELCEASIDQGGNLLCQHRFQSNAPAVRFVIPPRKFMRTVAGDRAAIF